MKNGLFCSPKTVIFLALSILLNLPVFVSAQEKNDVFMVERGKEVYNAICAVCHDKYGRGEGIGLDITDHRPLDFVNYETMSRLNDDVLFKYITGGKGLKNQRHNPAWITALRDEAVWDVIAYIRTLSAPDRKGSIQAGNDRFNTYCIGCHGMKGRGDGPIAKSLMKLGALKVKPRDFTDRKVMAKKTDDQLFRVILKGGASNHLSRYMAKYGSFADRSIWDLIAYIRTFSK